MQRKNRTVKAASKLAVLAMLTAVSVVLGIICKNLFTVAVYYRFTVENIGVIFAGIFFGPAAGVLVGVASDAISCVLSTNPAINPIISIGAASVGAVSGLISHYVIREHTDGQFIMSAAAAHLVGQVAIKSVGKMLYYGMPWYGIFIGLAMSVIACTVEAAVIRMLWRNREINKLITGITSK